MEWFFFKQDKLQIKLGHDYVRKHVYETHRAVVEALIEIVRKNDDILQPAEVIAAERVRKIMNFVLKMMDFVFKMMEFVLKMSDFGRRAR